MTDDDTPRPDNNPRRYDFPLWYYGADGPEAWCYIPPRPPDDLPGSRAAYVPSWRPEWRRPVSYDFEIRPPAEPASWQGPITSSVWVDETHMWITDADWAQCIAQRPPRWRRWTRRHLWFLTRTGRQNRELRRLIAAVGAKQGGKTTEFRRRWLNNRERGQ